MEKLQKRPFRTYHKQMGLLQSLLDNTFPTQLYAWDNSTLDCQQQGASFFGFVYDGTATITTAQGSFQLGAGMYCCVPTQVQVEGKGRGLLIEQRAFEGFFQLGGPIENKGRLQYIDGCTDSLLIAPPVWGNPCLNLLNIPAGTFQSQHTHPSFRIGMVVRGTGTCITPEGQTPLEAGLLFVIEEDTLHSFKTEENELLIVAYHPDSDFGPTDENHPMVNKTILN